MLIEISEFAKQYALSEREEEILSLLVNKVITPGDIGENLGISANTVKNHFQNIFTKTNTTSKDGILCLFVKFLYKKYSDCRLFIRTPQVLVVDDDQDICDVLNMYLSRKGLGVITTTDPTKVVQYVQERRIDCIVADIRMPKMDGLSLIKEIRKLHKYYPPIILISAFGDFSKGECMDQGASDVIEKPFDPKTIFFTIMENFVESSYEKSRFLRVESLIPVVVNNNLKLTIGNIGFGGVFIPVFPDQFKKSPDLEVGSRIKFSFGLEKNCPKISVLGEIVWRRTSRRFNLDPGIGVKFVEISDKDLLRVREFVRINKILSFIPIGERKPASKT